MFTRQGEKKKLKNDEAFFSFIQFVYHDKSLFNLELKFSPCTRGEFDLVS